MNNSYSKKREYLVNSIKMKAEFYKNELGSLYNQLSQMPADLSINELEELNDLSLFTDYLDYTRALQSRKLSDKLKSRCDKHINFSMIITDDGEAVFDTSIVDDDREVAKEDAWFREHDAGGVLVFEDYEDDGDELESDLMNYDNNSNLLLSKLNDELDEQLENVPEELDGKLSAEDKLLTDILKEMDTAESSISPKSFDDLNNLLDSINSGMTVEEIEDASKPSYDFFSDFSDDNDDDFELDLMNENYSSDNKDELSNYDFDKDIDEKLDDPDFKEDYNNKLNDKWGMFRINSPSITFEDLDSYDASYLCLFINRGLIGLPDDKSLIPDEVVDMLILGGVLSERPEKKVLEDVRDEEEKVVVTDENIIENSSNVNKRIFKSEQASNVVDKAGLLGNKLLSFGASKLKTSNPDILNPDESDEVFNEEIIECSSGVIGETEIKEDKEDVLSLNKDSNKFFGGFFTSVDVFELENDE